MGPSLCYNVYLCQPLCNDRGTSQMLDGPGLFAGAHVWRTSLLQVSPDPYCSRLALLCLCGRVQTGCGLATRQSVSWDCCHWWSEREREATKKARGERKRKMQSIPLIDALVFSVSYWVRGTMCMCVHVCMCEWNNVFLNLNDESPPACLQHSHPKKIIHPHISKNVPIMLPQKYTHCIQLIEQGSAKSSPWAKCDPPPKIISIFQVHCGQMKQYTVCILYK